MTDGDADATRLLALLRGVNVGRAKRVDMARLRDLVLDLGYADARTYLQSGYAIFSCRPSAVATAAANIEQALARELGVSSRVVVRTAAELAAAMTTDPLLELTTDPKKHLVGFLDADPDWIRVVGRHAYLLCAAGVLASPRAGWTGTRRSASSSP